MPIPYGLHRPVISNVSHPELRNTIRPSHYALIWHCIDDQCEVIDAFTGLTVSRKNYSVRDQSSMGYSRRSIEYIKSEIIPNMERSDQSNEIHSNDLFGSETISCGLSTRENRGEQRFRKEWIRSMDGKSRLP